MALTILFMLLFSLLLLLWDWRNKYYLLFILMMLGMSAAMVTLMVEVSRLSNYLIPANYLIRPLESGIYRFIYTNMRVPLSSMMLIRDVGIVMYLTTIVFFVKSFHNSIRRDDTEDGVGEKRRAWRYLLLAAYPLMYLVFYHPQMAWRIYTMYHGAAPGARDTISTLISVIDAGMSIAAIVYLAYPVVFIVHNYLKNKITFLSEQLSALAVSLGLLNVSFFILFFTGSFRPSVKSVLQYGFWRLPPATHLPAFYSAFMPLVTLVVLTLVFLSVTRFRTDNLLSSFKARGIRRNLDALYSNVRNVMHGEKTRMFTIRILALAALEAADEETRMEKLREIISRCDRNLSDMTRTLNSLHHMSMKATNHNFIDAVEAAVRAHPTTADVQRYYQSDNVPLRYDPYHMTEAIGNILGNSLEALESAQRADPVIRLTVSYSRAWVYFSVWDNGCGIPRHLVNKVYRPYISTKKKTDSWGIGLTYVFNVVRAYYGHFRVRSKQGQFTLVEILLPRDNVRRQA